MVVGSARLYVAAALAQLTCGHCQAQDFVLHDRARPDAPQRVTPGGKGVASGGIGAVLGGGKHAALSGIGGTR